MSKTFRICHIADLHFRALTRHNEFRTVFQALIDDVKVQNVDAIFIGGDIWHTKTQGISPEFIDLFNEIITKMAEVAPVHMTLGNHDGVLMNLSRQDAISPLVKLLNNDRIFLYKKSGVYQFAPGMNWCVFSLFDREGWNSVKPATNEYNIACYHGSVRGAKTETDWELTDGISVDFFQDYDLCLLGDIHKMQYLGFRDYKNGKKPWIAYPGSTIQQNFAEDLVHGYLLWEITDGLHDVTFRALPNPNPFLTISWQGSVAKTLKEASDTVVNGARFRVKSNLAISQKDIVELSAELKRRYEALEVTFKIDENINRDVVTSGTISIAKDDLRNSSVILEMMREFYESEDITDEQWDQISGLVEKYMKVASSGEEINRNTKWSVKKLEFDNLYTYGEGNVVNFEKLNGITGIFGPNRTGKSSLVGALLYTLFNSSDRGSIKNLEIVNERKSYGIGKAVVGVNGVDYLFERQTNKIENKRGVFGITNLNAFRLLPNGEKDDLNGEQRNDTDKTIRNLIGTFDDFMITGVSTQDDMKKFIKEGSTSRRQVISRFLDLDFFERVYDIANQDVKTFKAALKNLKIIDWNGTIEKKLENINEIKQNFSNLDESLSIKRNELSSLQIQFSSLKEFQPTTEEEVTEAEKRAKLLGQKKDSLQSTLQRLTIEVNDHKEKLEKLDVIKKMIDVDELKSRLESQRNLEASLAKLRHQHEKENDSLTRQEKSVLKLLEVPCGDSFPSCKFIKDSHQDKQTITQQRQRVSELLDELQKAEEALEGIKKENIIEKIKKCEQVQRLCSTHQQDIAKKSLQIVKLERELVDLETESLIANEKFLSLQEAHKNSENQEKVNLTQAIKKILDDIQGLERQKMMSMQQIGRLESDIQKLHDEQREYDHVSEQLKIYELVANSFSKKGIPNRIIHSQLPIINREVNKILAGIVNFTLEFQAETDSNALDIYINYGDSKRIIELGSGMEKVIASLAIRVALCIVTTLPKTDILIIDEGFSDLDEQQIETCNRMIRSLTKYFRNILIITHLAGIKEVVDNMIEVTRLEHDSKVIYE